MLSNLRIGNRVPIPATEQLYAMRGAMLNGRTELRCLRLVDQGKRKEGTEFPAVPRSRSGVSTTSGRAPAESPEERHFVQF